MLNNVVATYKDCRCYSPEPFAYETHDFESTINNIDNNKCSGEVHLPEKGLCLKELKQEAICLFKKILNSLECGTLPDLENLLEKLSLIEINEDA